MLKSIIQNNSFDILIIITKCPEKITEDEKNRIKLYCSTKKPIYFTKIKYGNIYSIFENKNISFKDLKNILLVTGIANTKPLTQELTKRNLIFKHLSYRDHYQFNEKDAIHISEIFGTFAKQDKIRINTTAGITYN